jgi:hypothetical protein
MDEKFTHFVDMIKKVNINVPFLETIRVPTYARYLKDILTKKQALPTSEVVKLTEQCKRRGRLAPCLYLGA